MTFVDIPGETSTTYVTTATDEGCDIQLVVIAVNASGDSLPADSNAIGLIQPAVGTVNVGSAGITSSNTFGVPKILSKVLQTVRPFGLASATAFGTPSESGGGRGGAGGGAVAGTDTTISDGNLYDSRITDGDVYAIVPEDGSRWTVRVSDAMAA